MNLTGSGLIVSHEVPRCKNNFFYDARDRCDPLAKFTDVATILSPFLFFVIYFFIKSSNRIVQLYTDQLKNTIK